MADNTEKIMNIAPKPQRPFVGAHLLAIKDNQVLLMKRGKTAGLSGRYSLVAGKVDRGENPSEAMIREAYEEANIKINPDDLNLVTVLHRSNASYQGGTEDIIEMVFCVKNWDGNVKNMEPELCEELSFYDINDLPDNTTSTVRTALKCYKNKVTFVEM